MNLGAQFNRIPNRSSDPLFRLWTPSTTTQTSWHPQGTPRTCLSGCESVTVCHCDCGDEKV
ncbi:predicted protein [Botrytis cinerea T4]|uniref:Uncharacterized protein n=1 Tax=Botryotinia fuckeliana (strain T4) TaxID=999810 RepID=G2YTM2_BOTF4|nr:predicted protein [Botrytis cinerea T4]